MSDEPRIKAQERVYTQRETVKPPARAPASHQDKTKPIVPQFDMALRHYQSGHLQEAESCLRDCLKERPSHVAAWHLIGTIEFEQGRHAAAIKSLQKAITLGPDRVDAYFTLGNAYRRSGQLGEAIAACQQLLQIQPNNNNAYGNLGVFYIEKGSKRSGGGTPCRGTAYLTAYR